MQRSYSLSKSKKQVFLIYKIEARNFDFTFLDQPLIFSSIYRLETHFIIQKHTSIKRLKGYSENHNSQTQTPDNLTRTGGIQIQQEC